MTLVVSGLGVTPVSMRQSDARLGGAGIQVESVAWVAAAWEVKTSSASASGLVAISRRSEAVSVAAIANNNGKGERWGVEDMAEGFGLVVDEPQPSPRQGRRGLVGGSRSSRWCGSGARWGARARR